MKRIVIDFPGGLKARLDALRSRDYTANGCIRAVLERERNQQAPVKEQKGG